MSARIPLRSLDLSDIRNRIFYVSISDVHILSAQDLFWFGREPKTLSFFRLRRRNQYESFLAFRVGPIF